MPAQRDTGMEANLDTLPEKLTRLIADQTNDGKQKLNAEGADMKAARDVKTTSPLMK